MRILKLKIQNLASIEDAEIDFTASPLADRPLFLITGNTGTGKTTILDAITIALYEKTPRFEETSRNEKVNDDDPLLGDVTTGNLLRLVRRGATFASVELEFEGVDGNVYVAKWQTTRKTRSDKRLKEPERELWRNGQRLSLNRKEELRGEIQRAVGMDFQQFTQTTLLAQGRFTEFLKSNATTKSAILEKILGTDIFSQVGSRIFERYSEKKELRNASKVKVESIAVLSPEEEQDVIRNQAETRAELKAIAQTIEAETNKYKWLKKSDERKSDIESARRKAEEARRVIDSEQMKASRADVDLWQKSLKSREALKALHDRQEELTRKKSDAATFRARYIAATAALLYQEESIEKESAELKRVDETLAPLAPHEVMLADATNILNDMAVLSDNAKTALKSAEGARSLRANVAEQEKLLGPDKAKLAELETANAKSAEEVANLKKEVDARAALGISQRLDNANEALMKLESLQNARRNLDTVTNELAEAQQEKVRADEALPKAAKEKEECGKALSAATKDFEDTQNRIGNARVLIAMLKPGDRCPVCGGTFAGAEVHSDGFDELLARKREAKEEASRLSQDAAAALSAAQSKAEVFEKRLKNVQKTFADMEVEFAAKADEAIKAAASCQIELSAAPKVDEVDAAMEAADKTRESLAARQDEYVKLQKLLSDKQQSLLSANGEVKKLRESIDARMLELNTNHGKISQLDELKRSSEERLNLGWEALRPKLSYAEPLSVKDLDDVMKRLMRDAQTFDLCQKRKRETQDKLVALQKEVTAAREQKSEVLSLMENGKWTESQIEPCAAEDGIVKIWTSLAADFKAWHDQIKELRAKIDQDVNLARERLAEAGLADDVVVGLMARLTDEGVEELRSVINSAEQQCNAAGQLLAKATDDAKAHEASRPALAEGDTAASVSGRLVSLKENQTAGNQKLGKLCNQIERNNEAKKSLNAARQELERAEKELAAWERLNAFAGDKTGSRFRRMALRLIMRELLSYANHHLKALSGQRFSLEPNGDDGLSFAIRDTLNYDRLQMPANLSGGEGFIVSLALALGLSSMAGGNGVVSDILFIDEGFGTLDAECLDKVIDLLGRLNESGKRVGIISHVEALRERIATQIRVSRVGQSSRVEVV